MTEPVDPVMVFVQGFLATFGNDCGKRRYEIPSTIGVSITEVDAESFDRDVTSRDVPLAMRTHVRSVRYGI
jgi:hypothetical protein